MFCYLTKHVTVKISELIFSSDCHAVAFHHFTFVAAGTMESAEPRKFNIVVFGASGFTGQFVVEEIARTMDTEARFTWAVAGRDMTKLQAVLSTASEVTGN